MKKICFYYHHINSIGGVEIAILNLIEKLYTNYDITVAYTAPFSDIEMLIRMSKYAKIANLNHKQIEVDTVVYCSIYCQKEKIKAKKQLRWVHGCFGDMRVNLPKEKIDNYIAVGKVCKEQLDLQLTGNKSTLIYNELNSSIGNLSEELILEKKTLTLVTVSRISKEKGFERMLKVSEKIKNVDYVWHIVGEGFDKNYENYIKKIAPENWVFHGKLENPFPYIKNADFLLQLSDYEAFGYVLLESLVLGTTVITTDYSSASEMINQTNGYIVKKDLSDFNPEILNNKKQFKHEYKSNIEQWKKLL
jgi:glycosyltransferase involved in cell wall biosynthesis